MLTALAAAVAGAQPADDWIIETVAGNGSTGEFGGYGRDGGAATAARLNRAVGVALHGGGPDLAGAPDLGAAFTPAEPGEFVTLFGTGFGATEPPLATGQIPGAAVNLANTVAFTFGGIAVPPQDVFYAGAAPCCAGLYQFTVRVPANLPDGDATVTAVVQGVSTPEGPYLTVRRPQ